MSIGRISRELLDHYGAPIREMLDDPTVTEILINGPFEIEVERDGRLQRTERTFTSETALFEFARQVAHALDQEIDPDTNPILDARLHDGSRVCFVLPPVSVGRIIGAIRPAPKHVITLDELLDRRMLDQRVAARIRDAVDAHENIAFSGGTGSGKTTLLRAFSAFIPAAERIVVIEDTTEYIAPNHPRVAMLEAASRSRPGDAHPGVSMARLIATAMWLRPDRIVVGEIRTPEAAAAFLEALNTGHGGTLTTLHANDEREALIRLRNLLARSAPGSALDLHEATVRANVGLVVHARKVDVGDRVLRRVTGVIECRDGEINTLFRYDPETDQWV